MAVVQARDMRLTLPSQAGPVEILKGISVQLNAGEMVSVVGPSGSGKTSMMMVLAGLERPTSGSVEIAGQDITRMSEDQLALFRRDHIGIVFQNFHLVPTMTAEENVALPLEFAGDSNAFAAAREALEAVGLSHRLGHYPAQLSGGEQQRVGLARAFVAKPALLLADEPTGNLDKATGEKVIEALFSLSREQGSTLMLITHDPAVAARCDRTLTMASGLLTEASASQEEIAA